MPNGETQPSGSQDLLNRVLADLLDALGRGDPVDLSAWQARYPCFAAELADLLAAHQEIGEALCTRPLPVDAQSTARSHPAQPLGMLGDYELLAEIGQGGMGRVYKAWQRSLNRVVALKVIRAAAPVTDADRLRFRTEAEAAARLDHPNIVPVYEVGEHDGQPYIATRYIEGGALSRHLDRFREDPRTAAGLVAVLARAVHHAHQRGVLHRDLKPGNVLLEWPSGHADKPVAYLADFGLARLLDQDSALTRTGELVGTPSYMAPEQASGGAATITTATDVHGLGAILYALLTGRPPFTGPTVLETLERVKGREPDRPRRLNPKVNRDLETVCLTCLAKDPHRRYASALALSEDLESWLAYRPIAARQATTRERLAKWVRRRPAAAAFALMSAAVLLAVLAGGLWHAHVMGEALADSDRLRQQGLAREARLRDFLYVADMRQAKEAWDSGDLPHLAELLERYRPAEGEADRRGFEWYWLKWCLGTRLGTLKAHDGGLLCAAVSPDDRFLATADRKGTVKVWDLASARQVATLSGHKDEVQRVVFSPDGGTLATCSTDKTVRLWDVATWRERACLYGHLGTVTSVAFSPDGTLLASTGRDCLIIVRELPKGRALRWWLAHTKVIHDVAFTADGRTLLSVGDDQFVRCWDVASGAERAKWRCGVDLLSLALSPDGKTLATGGYGDKVSVCIDPVGPTANLPVSWTVRALAFAPSGSQLVAAGDSGMLSVWDVGPGGRDVRLCKTLRRGEDKGRAAVFARRGALLVTASEDDGTVEFWDPRRLGGYETIPCLPPDLRGVALSPNGGAASAHGQQVCLLALEDRRIERTLPLQESVSDIAFSPDGRTVAACTNDQTRLWDVASGRQVLTLAGHEAGAKAVAFSPTGGLVATAGVDGTARLWEFPSGAPRAICAAKCGQANCLAFTPEGRMLAVGSNAHTFTVSLWDPSTRERQGTLSDPKSAAMRSHSSPVATPTGEQGFAVRALAFSPDGATLAAACSDGVIRLWDVLSGDLRLTFSGHVGSVCRLAFAPDGRTLASLGDDHALKLWHLGTGQQLFTLTTHTERLEGLAFSRDGRQLVAGLRTRDGAGPSSLLMWRTERADP
jgi:WD40 repeat protein